MFPVNPTTVTRVSVFEIGVDDFVAFWNHSTGVCKVDWIIVGVAVAINAPQQFANRTTNWTDPTGLQTLLTENDCKRRNMDSLTDDAQIKCDYANRLNKAYPDSGGLDYWLRFTKDNLKEALQLHQSGDLLAVVPLNFNPVTGSGAREDGNGQYQQLAISAFRNLETRIGRPPTFTEILAIIIAGEVAPILSGVNVPDISDGCGRTRTEFQSLTREAVQRYFHGQCRRDNENGVIVTGQCGPARLIGNLLANVQSFYDEIYIQNDYSTWINTARDLILGVQPGGAGCTGVNTTGQNRAANAPYIWGNTPSALFPLDPPQVGQGRVIDWISRTDGNYKYFVIQAASSCPTDGDRCGNRDILGKIKSRVLAKHLPGNVAKITPDC